MRSSATGTRALPTRHRLFPVQRLSSLSADGTSKPVGAFAQRLAGRARRRLVSVGPRYRNCLEPAVTDDSATSPTGDRQLLVVLGRGSLPASVAGPVFYFVSWRQSVAIAVSACSIESGEESERARHPRVRPTVSYRLSFISNTHRGLLVRVSLSDS